MDDINDEYKELLDKGVLNQIEIDFMQNFDNASASKKQLGWYKKLVKRLEVYELLKAGKINDIEFEFYKKYNPEKSSEKQKNWYNRLSVKIKLLLA